MSKQKSKYQSNYGYTIKVNGEYENVDIVQEENVEGRDAFKITYYTERWRTAEEWIELLGKIQVIINRDFK